MTMKEQLTELYKNNIDNFKSVYNKFPNDKLCGPFLTSPGELYDKQPNKLLVVGQETNEWSDEIDDIEKQMGCYEEFNVGINYRSSPFWNVTRKLEKALGNEPYSCAWTNISKFDVNGKRPQGIHLEEIKRLDSTLVDEINILKPDICIFFTSISFDDRIFDTFPHVVFTAVDLWDMRQLSQLRHPSLPALTFRTYHPKYLRMKGMEEGFIKMMKFMKDKK
jgi:hypothetical protein